MMDSRSAFGVRRSAFPDGGCEVPSLEAVMPPDRAQGVRDGVGPNAERRTPNAERGGSGHLAIAHVVGSSAVVGAIAHQPLKLVTAVPRGPMAWVYATSFGGGLVAGDALDLTVDVGADARLLLATQASTKIYRSDDGRDARQSFRATLAAHALLFNLPEPVTPFSGSRFHQTQSIDADPTAGVCWIDGVTAGRLSRDERWASASYRSRLELRVAGKLRWFDVLSLNGGARPAAQRLHGWGALATVLIGGPPLAELGAAIAADCAARSVQRGAPVLLAASPIADWGWALRLVAITQEQLDRDLRRLLAPLAGLAGDDPWHRRP
jgi:urease accessory protein